MFISFPFCLLSLPGGFCNDFYIYTLIRGNSPYSCITAGVLLKKEILNMNFMREKRPSRHEQIDAKLTRTFIGNQYSHR